VGILPDFNLADFISTFQVFPNLKGEGNGWARFKIQKITGSNNFISTFLCKYARARDGSGSLTKGLHSDC